MTLIYQVRNLLAGVLDNVRLRRVQHTSGNAVSDPLNRRGDAHEVVVQHGTALRPSEGVLALGGA